MRKFVLITALLLASASAQAEQTRGLTVASNDEPASVEKIESVKPQAAKAEVKPEASKPEIAQPGAAKPEVAKTETTQPEVSEPKAVKPAPKAHVRNYDSDEARARKIAARYGISW
ncbi:MAG: hypothetical protein E7813_24360 [Bradyrhizobium sp.]|uniref:hypothetical protein n=1 Tax=Bradyrhizobium sp. TaxID=376 RepID=UPI0012290D94|nr:hypothetical protein [Bradyrhizobium sp.]THD59844.1 MAG: hypothetical protein E7813_24360 [Bradyrhizobium sp.]